MQRFVRRIGATVLAMLVMAAAAQVRLHAQDRLLGREDILLYGFGLRVEPAHQVVPKDIATIVSTFLASGTPPQGGLPAFAPDALVKGVLFGPGYPNGLELTSPPNTPFNIPPIGVPGIYTFENIRLESGGDVLMRGIPESVTIEVIEKLLVTQVTARALTAQEVRDKGIVFDSSNFQAYNFTAAFALQDTPVHITFPVVLPTLQGAQNATVNTVDLASVPGATLPQLATIIPDTLKLQTQVPNLQVVGFTLKVPNLEGKQLIVPPIPGVVVIPGDIGFLNQFFSVMLLVGNVAPDGSNLVVSDLKGEILLPAGNDGVVNSGDDPLRMANTTGGESPRIRAVVQPGADGRSGTVDDIPTIGPGESGSAEYLVEGRREGSWNVEFNITGTLHGLPVGPVTVTGRAAGAVLVRNPNFTLTFTHPGTVTAGEKYSLDITVTNTSTSPANFVSVNLFSQNISGAGLVGDPLRTIESIPPGDSATVSFDLIARVTGKVTAATLDSDEKVQGRFALKTAVGELGVPLSPDSLVLPAEASGLPADLRNAVLGMLGKAWAVATAPSVALPKDVQRFSKQIVFDRAVQAAEAGFRIALHEPVPDSAAQLEMDFLGSDFTRLQALHPDPAELQFTQIDVTGFDALRRRSVRGDVLANAVAALLAPELTINGAGLFHRSFAEKTAYRPAQLSVVVSSGGAPLPFDVSLVDAQGRRLGGADSTGKIIKEIPFGDLLSFTESGVATGAMLLLGAPDAGQYHLRFAPREGVAAGPVTVSIVVPDGAGGLRHVVYTGVTSDSAPTSPFMPGAAWSVVLDLPIGGGSALTIAPSVDEAIVAPLPHIVGVVQQADKDLDEAMDEGGDTRSHELGRIIAVLFDQEVTRESAQDRLPRGSITNYEVDGNSVVGVALQPGRRIAFLALRDPIGPFIPRQLTVTGVRDGRGRVMSSATRPIEATVTRQAAVVSGQVIDADGTPVPSANVRLLIKTTNGFFGVSSKSADANGRFSWDWVPSSPVDRIVAVNPANDDQRVVDFTVQRNGQRLNVNVVFLGRGTLAGRTVSESGAPLPNTDVVVTSLTDQSQYGVRSDDQGRFAVQRVPVGNILIEAVNVPAHSKGTASEWIPVAGATVTRDVRLFDVTAPTIVVKLGTLTGHVLRGDGASPVGDVPVVAYYQAGSQTGVDCPDPRQVECAVAVVRTDASGRFVMENITAGQLRIVSFEQSSFQQGEARVNLPPNAARDVNILFSQGLGTVNGTVVDANGQVVAGARVGGGLSLTTTDQSGHFTLTDVPVGRREIVAVSDQLATTGASTIDILQPGQVVNVTVVLTATAAISGTVFEHDGTTPVPHNKVYLFYRGLDNTIVVVATAVTDDGGHYAMQRLPIKDSFGADIGYELSSFRPDFSDGNVKLVVLKFNNQVFNGNIVFRGGGGHVNGHVYDADGVTPLRAAVGISGDQVVVAGGMVGTGFQRVTNYQVAQTDFTSGGFSFNHVFVGPFTLSAAGQFSPDPISFDSRIQSPGGIVDVDLRLQATSRLEGTVLLPDGVTPAGANVIVRFKSSAVKVVCASTSVVTVAGISVFPGDCAEIPQGIQSENAVTDSSGRFVVPLVNAGSFTLTAEDPVTGKTGQVLGTIRPGQNGDFSIRLLGTSALLVRVRGSDSTTPIPGARVEVQQVGFPNKSVTTFADGEGNVLLNGGDAFTEGDVVVNATDVRNGFAGRASGRVTKDGDTVTLTVFLFDAAGTVSGVVYRSDGLTPVPNAEVVITRCDPASSTVCVPAGPLAFAVTDANGAYRQGQIPLGAFRVDVFEAATARLGFGSGRIDFPNQEVPLDITEAGRGLVTGTALAASTLTPLTNWEVLLRQTTPGGRQIELKAASDIDGTFAFPGVTVGDFRLVVSKRQDLLQPDVPYGNAEVRSRLTTDGQHVDVPVIVQLTQKVYGRVEGLVFNANGTPAASVSVVLCPGCVANANTPLGQLFAVTGADGSFSFERVPIGRFTMLAKDQTSLDAATGAGELLFDGDIARLTLALVGTGRISGTVEFSDGRPATTAQLTLYGNPSSGCDAGSCLAFTDGTGHFTFIDIPARTFWIRASDAVSGLSGTVSGELAPGDPLSVRIVLQPTGAVSGRVLFERGAPAPGITAELTGTGALSALHLFQVSDQNGLFTFPAAPIGSYTLDIQDPIGPGVAQRHVQVTGAIALGDVTLDETRPSVASTTPAASSTGVALNSTIRITFSERVNAGTVTQSNIVVAGPTGPLLGTLALTTGDREALFTPLSPLLEKTRYTISVQNVTDLVGKVMAPFSAGLVTVDLTPPSILEITPPVDGHGIPLATTVRVKFSEPVDPTRYRGPPIALLRGEGVVDGRTDYILGNTVVVFTPTLPLEANAVYQALVAAATDLSGNVQQQPLNFEFHTFDYTPPQVTALVAGGNGSVIENATTQVVAVVDALHDISVVDFYVNDQPAFASRTAPYTLSLQAAANLGRPGDQIKISAFATDTSGNRSVSPAVLLVPIVADAPPVAAITAPAAGAAFRTGDRVTVAVRSTDDLGVNQVGYRAVTGNPQDAASVSLAPVADTTTTFAFVVPRDAVPGSSIAINASATDIKGQGAAAVPVVITVLDATLPTVTITGTTSGTRVAAGQETNAIVLAEDLGGIAAVTFTTGGVVVGTTTRPVSPAQNSVAASFAFTVPATARPGDTLTLDAIAVDAAGNVGTAARLLLPVADLSPPTVRLRTASGTLDLVPGTTATAVVEVTDDTAVASASLQGQGAFSFSTARQVSPPSNSAALSFAIAVPADATDGATLNLAARATDVFGNLSAPVTLTLTVRSSQSVTLPPSAIVAAGSTTAVAVQLTPPAGPEGVRVDLRTDDASIARVDPSVQFNDGESSKSVTVTGVSGGVTTLTALVNNVPRASMTLTVRGGIVSGVVVNDQLQPVSGANVAVSSVGGFSVLNAVTDATGSFSVEGVGAGFYTTFTVKAFDPATQFIGFASGSLNVPNGFARVTVVLVSAGSIGGSVTLADGVTPAPAGARVDLFSVSQPAVPLGTVFTDDLGAYEFPIVSLGSYFLEASDVHGNRGRSAVLALSTTGQHANVNVAYLGRGSVTGIVRNGSGSPVPNVPVTLTSTNLFGYFQPVQINALPDGTFRFDNVFVGSFTVQARDPISNRAGTVAGSIQQDGQVVPTEIVLAPWATLQGTVFRSDGVTPVPNVRVDLSGGFSTVTDVDGHYTLQFVPLGFYQLVVTDVATSGIAVASGTLSVNGEIVTRDLVFFPLGTLVVTVRDGGGQVVAGASVTVTQTTAPGFVRFGTTDANGVVLIEHVVASPTVQIAARAGSLSGTVTTTLQGDEVKAVTVNLMPTGSITGTVFLPDGQSPATSGTIMACGYGCATLPIGSDGRYRFDNLPLYKWTITVTDANNRKRAIKRDILLETAGQVATVDVTLAGIGSVAGRVLNPDSSSASDILVSIRTLDPDLGGFSQARTNAAGFYQANGIVVGGVSVTAGDPARSLLGEASGTLLHDGETLGLDILLKNNALTLPVTKNDANFFTFDLQRDGSIGAGFRGVFGYDCCPVTSGALYLDVIANGTPTRFTGAAIGTTEDFGRQVVVSQTGVAGLNVTRKMLVPTAYFARYLELLTNPTTSPITVDVRLHSQVKASGLFTTSSGDNQLDLTDAANPDRWAMFNIPDYDPILTGSYPQAGFIFDGAGASARASIASVQMPPSANHATFEYGWTGVTIQPGQTVAFMHFAVQQYNRAAARASLERLAQLPPEALESLSPVEIAAIRNFAVPADGTSAVAPLPALGGVITGRLLEADSTTPVVSQQVRLRSQNIFFGRLYQAAASPNGTFSFGGANVNVPIDGFTLDADHPVTRVVSAPVTGSFVPGVTTATADIVFSNTGIVRGTVRRASGQLVVGAAITATSSSGFSATFAPSGNDGSFVAAGLPPGSVTVVASIVHPQGGFTTTLVGSATVGVIAGQAQTRDLTVEPTGTLTGTVKTALGAAAPNVLVQVNGCRAAGSGCFQLQTRTDSAGVYRFTDVPVASMTVRAFDPNTNFPVSGDATVAADQTSTLNLTFVGTGSISVVAKLANGNNAASAYTEVVRPLGASGNYTDANGRVTITSVLPGPFILRVHHPNNFSASVDVTGTISFTGQTVNVTTALPPVGTLLVQVRSGGAPVANVTVNTNAQNPNSMQLAGFTNSAGEVRQFNVPGGRPIQVVSFDSTGQHPTNASATITAEGQTATVVLPVDASGTIAGQVLRGTTAVPSVFVTLSAAAGNDTRSTQTGPDGRFIFDGAPLGLFRVSVRDTAGNGWTDGQVVQPGEVITANISLNATSMANVLLADANGFSYRVGGGGYLSGGAYSSFPSLSVGAAGSFGDFFAGDAFAVNELNGRQLVISNVLNGLPLPMSGMTVKRKVYVDPSGYFTRILDVIENPGATLAVLDVGLRGTLSASNVLATSSGDTTADSADQWMVTNSAGSPASHAAFVVAGSNPTLPLTQFQVSFGSVSVAWNSLVVPAGGRRILMHFEAQASDQATATAMAQRLAQLPPEALEGLTTDEIAAIQNFVVPAGGTSTLAPFGAISGRVVGGDGVSPAPNVRVLVTGNAAPYFKPTVTVFTDSDGRYLARTLAAGPVTVQAMSTNGQATTAIVAATSDGQTTITTDLMFTTTGVLTGTVRRANGQVAPGVPITVNNQSFSVFESTLTGADGSYRLPTLPAGSYTLQARLNDGRTATAAGIAVSAGSVANADLQLTAAAGLRVTVTKAGAPFAGARITRDGFFVGSTGSAGTLLMPSVLAGPFTLQVSAPNSSSGVTLNGVIRPEDDGTLLDVSVQVLLGSVNGTVTAADGLTPIPYTSVSVLDEASNATLGSTGTDAAGHYEVLNMLATGPFRVVAHGPGVLFSATAEAVRSFDVSTTLTVNLQVPLAAVKGRVFQADHATLVPNAQVTFAQEDEYGSTQTQSSSADGNGSFTFFARRGIFDLEARDNLYWYAVRASGTVIDLPAPQVVDLTLPALGAVQGVVRDANGQPVPFTTVTIQSTRTPMDSGTGTSAGNSGAYVFDRVPVGGFALQACTYTAGWVCGAAGGVVPGAGQTTTVDITLPSTGTVSGTAFDTNGTTPMAYAHVSVAPVLDGRNFNGNLPREVYADATGHYIVDNVQAGPVTVTLLETSATGLAFGTVSVGVPVTIDVTRGTATSCRLALYDAANVPYFSACSGALTDNGMGAYGSSNAYTLRINGQSPSGAPAARMDIGGRQAVYGPFGLGTVTATRKLFVPATGRFARYLDTITNPTSTTVTVDVQIDSALTGAVHLVVDPATTGTYALSLADPYRHPRYGYVITPPVLGHVFSALGAPVQPNAVVFQQLLGSSYYRWSITLAPGQSMTFMHFAFARNADDTVDANNQAHALVDLSDPNALAGMTPAEKASVVNFVIP